MNVHELIQQLLAVEEKQKEIRMISADHSNDAVDGLVTIEGTIYICGK